MRKLTWAIGSVVLLAGCHVVTDGTGASSRPEVITVTSGAETGSGPSPFVGTFGTKTPHHGMMVSFAPNGSVSVRGLTTNCDGTYTTNDRTAQALFSSTNVPTWQRTVFTLSSTGKSVWFQGPKGTVVHLPRTR